MLAISKIDQWPWLTQYRSNLVTSGLSWFPGFETRAQYPMTFSASGVIHTSFVI
jgi:hypothetical protein